MIGTLRASQLFFHNTRNPDNVSAVENGEHLFAIREHPTLAKGRLYRLADIDKPFLVFEIPLLERASWVKLDRIDPISRYYALIKSVPDEVIERSELWARNRKVALKHVAYLDNRFFIGTLSVVDSHINDFGRQVIDRVDWNPNVRAPKINPGNFIRAFKLSFLL